MATDDRLRTALSAARARWPLDPAGQFPSPPSREPEAGRAGTGEAVSDQEVPGPVPTVPTVPAQMEERPRRTAAEVAADALAEWEERAGIIEYDGEFSRAEAEARATAELGGRQ